MRGAKCAPAVGVSDELGEQLDHAHAAQVQAVDGEPALPQLKVALGVVA